MPKEMSAVFSPEDLQAYVDFFYQEVFISGNEAKLNILQRLRTAFENEKPRIRKHYPSAEKWFFGHVVKDEFGFRMSSDLKWPREFVNHGFATKEEGDRVFRVETFKDTANDVKRTLDSKPNEVILSGERLAFVNMMSKLMKQENDNE